MVPTVARALREGFSLFSWTLFWTLIYIYNYYYSYRVSCFFNLVRFGFFAHDVVSTRDWRNCSDNVSEHYK